MHRLLRGIVLVLLIGLLAAGEAAAADGRQSHSGTIDGARFRVEVPERWNGTLVLYSHGYQPPGFPDLGVALTNRPPDRSETERWLLDHGYAMAASQFQDKGTGYQVANALRDQIALLDWFEQRVGRPRHTVATGQSMGAAIAILLAERNPDRFDGVATFCGGPDPLGTFNAGLDVNFAVKTLLAPDEDVELVRASDPARAAQVLAQAIDRAVTTPEGRARLALAGALNNVSGWYTGHGPRPTELDEWIRQQAEWIKNAYTLGFGPLGRADLERRAGGNPLGNHGIDYGRQLQRSAQTALVKRAYEAAGLDLRADLDRLAGAPRIAPDPEAVAFMYRYGVPRGHTPAPVVTLHTTGDGGAVPDQERWYAKQVRRSGDPAMLRQLYIERGMHCSISAAEEIVTLQSLLERIDRGRWPDTSPDRLNAAASALGAGYDLVLDFGTFQDAPMAPGFAEFTPPRAMRPSR